MQTAPAKSARSARELLEEKKKQEKDESKDHRTILQHIRGAVDALVFAYVLAMFIRSYVFELYMIPTGSMTPTLIGDSFGEVAFVDYDKDGVEDVVYTMLRSRREDQLQIFLMNADGSYKQELFLDQVDPRVVRELAARSVRRTDMIIVNKFAYWFRSPNRGEIAVFKVPDRPNPTRLDQLSIYEPTKPVYIKRVLGEPGEVVTIPPATAAVILPGHANRRGTIFGGREFHLNAQPIEINGQPLETGIVSTLTHFPKPEGAREPWQSKRADVLPVSEDAVMLVGDNAASSLDGRYWGDVPLNHLRGKAVFRYSPWKHIGFLK